LFCAPVARPGALRSAEVSSHHRAIWFAPPAAIKITKPLPALRRLTAYLALGASPHSRNVTSPGGRFRDGLLLDLLHGELTESW